MSTKSKKLTVRILAWVLAIMMVVGLAGALEQMLTVEGGKLTSGGTMMLVISMGFAGMDMMDMVWKAFWCLIWQGVLALLANIAIWVVTFFRFDAKGNIRKRKTQK